MRKIKFRAWDTKENKYLYSEEHGFVCTTHSNGLGVTIPIDITEKHLGKIHDSGIIQYMDYQMIDWADADLITRRYELEQFTELYDMSGNEIYEGDIVILTRKTTKSIIYKVVWDSFYTGYYLISLELDDIKYINEEEVREKYKVIGNIHENKEFLHDN